jgi:alpha-tubulin suppressor-like RCC1 family protein
MSSPDPFVLYSTQFSGGTEMKRLIRYGMIVAPIILIVLTAFASAQELKVISADGGNAHTIALRDDGTVWTYGSNKYYGQLGDGTWIDKNIPTRVALSSDVVAIASGQNHCSIVRQDGTVWGWGLNTCYQLGDGTNINKPAPVQVKDPSDPTGFLTGVVAVKAGDNYSLALKTNGTVWAWGCNGNGRLGDGTYDNRTQPVQVKDPSDPSGFLQGVVAIAAGGGHSIALKSNGTVWTCGRNLEGQLGDGTTTSSFFPPPEPPKFFVQVIDPADPTGYLTGITAIAADDRYSLAVKSNGTAWRWGSNYAGVLCDGTTNNNKTSPAQMKDPSDPTGFLTGVKTVGAGEYHSLIIKNDGTLWGCGWNYDGQLGIGTYDSPKLTPVQAVFPEPSMLYVWSLDYISPGDEVTFLIEYENVSGETLEDAVVIFDLPGGFLYTSSTNDGIYRDDRSEVFWKLGDVSPGQTGSLAVKVEVPWGLPLHTEITVFADMAARNITSSINVDDYLTYIPVELISETSFSETEINALLSFVPI